LKKSFLLLIFLLTTRSSLAKPDLILNLESALDIAIENSIQLNIAKTELDIKNAEIKIARARLNPNLVSDNGIAEKTYRLGLEKTFEMGNKRKKRIEVAEISKKETETKIDAIKLDIETDIRKTYAQLFTLQEKNKLFQDLLETNQGLLDLAKKREASGDIANIDMLQIEMANLKIQNDMVSLSTELQTARSTFNSLLNQDLETEIELINPNSESELWQALGVDLSAEGDKVNPEVLVRLYALADSKRPELANLQIKNQLANKELELAYSQRIPNLSLTAGPDLVINDGASDDLGFFVSGSLQLPIFNRNQGEILSARASQKQIQQEQELLKRKITLEINNRTVTALNLEKQLNHIEKGIVEKSKIVSEKTYRCFEEGKCSTLTVIANQESYINAQIVYYDMIQAYQTALVNLARAVGVSL